MSFNELKRLVDEHWGEGLVIEWFAPSLAGSPTMRRTWGLFERAAASPGMVASLLDSYREIDVTAILPTLRVPTVVLHRTGDPAIPVEGARLLSELIPEARYVELEGDDHIPWFGDSDALLDEIEEFLTGNRHLPEPDRALATVLFTDIVGSTELHPADDRRRQRPLPDRVAYVPASAGGLSKVLAAPLGISPGPPPLGLSVPPRSRPRERRD